MSIEYNPVGVQCNLSCSYCYENAMRDAGNFTKEQDIEAVKEALLEEGAAFTTFGGEPLRAGKEHLEEIWQFGKEQFGRNTIQTNGTLIDDEWIRLFKKYNVSVGISMDGKGSLNDSRWAGSLEQTRENTKKSLQAIDKLLAAGITPSLIITLYQGNANEKNLPELKDWCRELDQKGIRSARLHFLEVDHKEVEENLAMTDQQNVNAMIELHQLQKQELSNLKFAIFKDIKKLLLGDDRNVTCTFNACDPYTTDAVQGVDSNGDRANCPRTNKRGVNWHKAKTRGRERQLALYHTDWDDGGCKGCRFFMMCKGQCVGTGDDGDWRNKSNGCWVWYQLFEYMEDQLVAEGELPVSLHPDRKGLEHQMIRLLSTGRNTIIDDVYDADQQSPRRPQRVANGTAHNHGDRHGDREHQDHSDSPDGDHGDKHGDHYDDPTE